MTITITFDDSSTRMLNTSQYFQPHSYETIGNNHYSNLQALIEDFCKNRIPVQVLAYEKDSVVIDRRFQGFRPKYSYAKTLEEKNLIKELKRKSYAT